MAFFILLLGPGISSHDIPEIAVLLCFIWDVIKFTLNQPACCFSAPLLTKTPIKNVISEFAHLDGGFRQKVIKSNTMCIIPNKFRSAANESRFIRALNRSAHWLVLIDSLSRGCYSRGGAMCCSPWGCDSESITYSSKKCFRQLLLRKKRQNAIRKTALPTEKWGNTVGFHLQHCTFQNSSKLRCLF